MKAIDYPINSFVRFIPENIIGFVVGHTKDNKVRVCYNRNERGIWIVKPKNLKLIKDEEVCDDGYYNEIHESILTGDYNDEIIEAILNGDYNDEITEAILNGEYNRELTEAILNGEYNLELIEAIRNDERINDKIKED